MPLFRPPQLPQIPARFNPAGIVGHAFRDVAARFNLQVPGVRRDVAARFRLLASGARDVAARFLLQSVATYRDVQARLRIAGPATRDTGARFNLKSVESVVLPFATVGPLPGPTGGSQQGHLFYAANTGRWWFVCFVGILDSGTATGGTNQTLSDTTKAWSTGQWTGCSCWITAGTGAGETFEIGTTAATSVRIQDNDDPATPYHLNFTIDSTSQYVIVDTRSVVAYVSSGADLTSATWSLASGGRSAQYMNAEAAIDLPGGRWDGNGANGGGEHPTDGRQLAVAYASISGHDVLYAMVQTGGHWFKGVNRGRITAATTVAWDNNQANTNPWDDTFGIQEALPFFLQSLALTFDSNNSRWHVFWERTDGVYGSAWNVNDPGTGTANSLNVGWTGAGVTGEAVDSTTATYQAGLAQLGAGVMLAVYGNGSPAYTLGTWGAGQAKQTGLRYAKSTSGTAWPTNNASGAAVPGLSSASNSPNDWSMVARTTTDVHVVRRNSATVLEHLTYSGTAWSSVDTLPTAIAGGGTIAHQANGGVVLASDGTSVWCFILDGDANHSIRQIRWQGGSWDANWQTVAADTSAKSFLTGGGAVTANRTIGLAWSEGPDASGHYAAIATTVSAATTAYRDVAGRFRLASAATWRDVAGRFRLQSVAVWKDVAGRFRLAAQATRDVSGRFRLASTATWRDVQARVRLQSVTIWRDVQARYRLQAQAWRDVQSRFRLQAQAWRDVQARFKLTTPGVWRDVQARFRLQSATVWRDVQARVRLQSAATYRDVASRFRLLAQGVRDVQSRFRLQSVATYRDVQARLRLQAQAWRDVAARFRLQSVTVWRDTQARFRLQSATTYRDIASRFRLAATAWRDVEARFRLAATGFRDVQARFKLTVSGQAFRDVAARFRLASAATWRDVQARFRLQSVTIWRDVAGRFLLRAAAVRDVAGRFKLQSATVWRDVQVRFRLAATSYRDVQARTRLQSAAVYRDVASRVRLQAQAYRDVPARFRLLASATRDVATRLRIQSQATYRDVAARFNLHVAVAGRDVAARFNLTPALLAIHGDSTAHARAFASTAHARPFDSTTQSRTFGSTTRKKP